MTPEEIDAGIARFPSWHYEFELGGRRTPVPRAELANRHRERKAYFLDPVVELLGGSLEGKRVLDLGCNAGYWTRAALMSGCDEVVAIDGRPVNLEQARFVLEASGIDEARYRLVEGDVLEVDLAPLGSFDIVLCLGLLYHLRRPDELLERVAPVNTDLLVIDTALSTRRAFAFEEHHESIDVPLHAIKDGRVLYPTRRAVRDLAAALGYSVAVLAPHFRDPAGLGDYRFGRRRAFVCAKTTDLEPLSPLVETDPSWLAHAIAHGAARVAAWSHGPARQREA